MAPAKGKSRWHPRSLHPVHNGFYECVVRLAPGVHMLWGLLEWDGVGFKVPCPMRVLKWRGLTKKPEA